MNSIKLVFNKVIPVTKIKINIIFHCKFTELFERNPAVTLDIAEYSCIIII